MKARFAVTLSALTLTALAGASARADETAQTLAWQEPGYVMDVVVVTAPRPEPVVTQETAEDVVLAWQEPGYVEDVVVVKASRREVLAAAWSRLTEDGNTERRPFMGRPAD